MTLKEKFLANGNVIETKDKSRYLVLNDKVVSFEGYNMKEKHNDDLTFKGDSFFDIIKVYRTSSSKVGDVFEEKELHLLWERPEPKVYYKVDEETLKELVDYLKEKEIKIRKENRKC